jgi:hypothetical protein
VLPSGLQLAALAAAGLVAGLWLLVRGFRGYGEAARIADTSTSRIASLAIGEVRVTGVVEPAELTLVSPLQSAPCVYYRAAVTASGEGVDEELFDEERAVGFRVRDESGSVRVFPHGGRFDVPDRWTESSGMLGESPAGLRPRSGSAFGPGPQDHEAQVAALLTVRPAAASPFDGEVGPAWAGSGRSRTRRYREARIEPGDVVTVVGQVLPFDQLPDPAGADVAGNAAAVLHDEETAANLAEARAAGLLAATPEAAWGNAAIPGFGIGRPVAAPVLDPAAAVPTLASAAEAATASRTFDIAPADLVLAAAPDAPLVVALGPPGEAAARHEQRFLLGLLGALLAIGSAVVLAVVGGDLLR